MSYLRALNGCNAFVKSNYPSKGTFYILYSKKDNSKILIHDTSRIFLFREPNSTGESYRTFLPDSKGYRHKPVKELLSDKPNLIEFFNLKYTPVDLLKYGMPLSNEKLSEYSTTNELHKLYIKL